MQGIRYRVVLDKGKYVYARCGWNGCGARLRYRLQAEGRLTLTRAICNHSHSLNRCRKYKFQAVSNFLLSLPGSIPLAALKQLVCPQFAISDKQLYYIASKIRGRAETPEELVRALEK